MGSKPDFSAHFLVPFPDELFSRNVRYLVCELNYDGQLVREVMRAVPDKSKVHFMGRALSCTPSPSSSRPSTAWSRNTVSASCPISGREVR